MAKNYRITYMKGGVRFSEKVTVDAKIVDDPDWARSNLLFDSINTYKQQKAEPWDETKIALEIAKKRCAFTGYSNSKNIVLKVEEI